MLPRPEVTEFYPDDLPTEFRCVSAFAPLMAGVSDPACPAGWSASRRVQAPPPEPPRPLESLHSPHSALRRGRAMAPAAPGLELALLERFQRLMAAEGLPVQLARMGYDRLYALDRLTLGCRSASQPLLQLSRQLWRLYDERPGGRTALH